MIQHQKLPQGTCGNKQQNYSKNNNKHQNLKKPCLQQTLVKYIADLAL
jgi:hypothetical protein